MSELQPNSRACFICGLENPLGLKLKFHVTGPGEVTTVACISEQYQGYPGVVHGGVVAAILDEVVARAMMGTDPSETRFMVTARLNIRFRKRVPVNQELKVVGRVGRSRKRTITAHGRILDDAGELLAEAEAVLVDMPPETQDRLDLEALGWRIYPVAGPERTRGAG